MTEAVETQAPGAPVLSAEIQIPPQSHADPMERRKQLDPNSPSLRANVQVTIKQGLGAGISHMVIQSEVECDAEGKVVSWIDQSVMPDGKGVCWYRYTGIPRGKTIRFRGFAVGTDGTRSPLSQILYVSVPPLPPAKTPSAKEAKELAAELVVLAELKKQAEMLVVERDDIGKRIARLKERISQQQYKTVEMSQKVAGFPVFAHEYKY